MGPCPSYVMRKSGHSSIFLAFAAVLAIGDGLKGFPEAITTVFPDTVVQTCIMHQNYNSLKRASWKERKTLALALRSIYPVDNIEAAEHALNEFESGSWGERFPIIARSWRGN